jgi:hypothetical protein
LDSEAQELVQMLYSFQQLNVSQIATVLDCSSEQLVESGSLVTSRYLGTRFGSWPDHAGHGNSPPS